MLDSLDDAFIVRSIHICDRSVPANTDCFRLLLNVLPVNLQRYIFVFGFNFKQSVDQTRDQLCQAISTVRIKRVFRTSKLYNSFFSLTRIYDLRMSISCRALFSPTEMTCTPLSFKVVAAAWNSSLDPSSVITSRARFVF